MNQTLLLTADVPGNRRLRIALVVALLLAVTCAHWWTPRGGDLEHVVHVALRKLYIMPVVLAAVWFNLRGALVTAGTVALLYVPHVALQWGGQRAENINQLGEIVTIALAATVAGILVSREKRALGELAAAYRGTARALNDRAELRCAL